MTSLVELRHWDTLIDQIRFGTVPLQHTGDREKVEMDGPFTRQLGSWRQLHRQVRKLQRLQDRQEHGDGPGPLPHRAARRPDRRSELHPEGEGQLIVREHRRSNAQLDLVLALGAAGKQA